jgi:hypothetical protein
MAGPVGSVLAGATDDGAADSLGDGDGDGVVVFPHANKVSDKMSASRIAAAFFNLKSSLKYFTLQILRR